ncbi:MULTISPECIES: universal stress protein [unclassified Oleiphilus]|jgi:nucleotide-binding universal stress UspA family protein|uniref:universal stress protein n=5 Tax=Oleiphilus TaxID=141450 RepID=UPI0007C2C310|nr:MULTISPECIES: universal stress protein [unclassified Oleiphilus]KZY43252.1 hypothetical protein A3732_14675 [Oleiphilus sp. HI0050]KZY76384.1 hypothetical protein A3740_12945 [Oleiphilus sp. HI0068]KZY76783.1 hypothetical protein A3741_10675 [Oleiphilus sp. HI0069]KZY87441.1 hypothetical protein A3743_14430 [Oleiphilus sp. HI0072]KZZ11701.1 hypothetical protein A3749_08265 [Oleiphilus sp. HI0078]
MKLNHIMVPISPGGGIAPSLGELIGLRSDNDEPLEVKFITVIEDADFSRISGYMRASPATLLEHAINVELERLDAMIALLEKKLPDVLFEREVVTGVAFINLILSALRGHYDCIAISKPSTNKKDSSVMGSTLMHLMRKSPTPTFAIGHQKMCPEMKIAAAIDVSNIDVDSGLNQQILDAALSLAELYRAELHIVHIWHLAGEGYLSTWGRRSDFEVGAMAREEKHSRKERVDALTGHAKRRIREIHLVEGQPKNEIPKFVDDQSIDILVMGTVCRSNVAGMIIGNTAESILGKVNCSVLTLKPEGFESPVVK